MSASETKNVIRGALAIGDALDTGARPDAERSALEARTSRVYEALRMTGLLIPEAVEPDETPRLATADCERCAGSGALGMWQCPYCGGAR